MSALRRFRAPTTDRGLLAEPALSQLPALIESNRATLNTARQTFGGFPLQKFREQFRKELDLPDSATPLIVSGHQPELSHPGVWVKNFALCGIARQVGGVGLNLIVDNDTLKSPSIIVPIAHSAKPTVPLRVFYDDATSETPYETRTVHNQSTFGTFAERVAIKLADWPYQPILHNIWPTIVADPAATIGERFANARIRQEQTWGCVNRELRISDLVRTKSFAMFATEIASDLPRFRSCYNRAVEDYRRLHGIRSVSHPVPNLGEGELPFWGPVNAAGRRERATANTPPTDLRPRALTLTLLTRLGLGDFFLHGIGGGKYDEVTDQLMQEFYGIEPPSFQVFSATLYLPVPPSPIVERDLQRLRRTDRDLYWNPQRHLSHDLPQELLSEHARLAAHLPSNRAQRRERYRNLRRIAELLRPLVGSYREVIEQSIRKLTIDLQRNQLRQRRDCSWVLYSESTLREFLEPFATLDTNRS